MPRRLFVFVLMIHACLPLVPAAGRDWPQWGGSCDRNMVCRTKGLPADFDPGVSGPGKTDPAATRNVRWVAKLGSQTYGTPTIFGGRVFVGTNNGAPRDRKYSGDRHVLMCFREADGRFLWQFNGPKVPEYKSFNGDFPKLGVCCSPTVDGDRVYIVTSRNDVLCLDVHGLANGNDGPFTDEAALVAKPRVHRITEGAGRPVVEFVPGKPVPQGPADADVIWRFDMMKELNVWPQDATSCSVLIRGNCLYVGTSNGVDRSHRHIPNPQAPSLIVLDKRTGKLLAVDDAGIGPNIYHGQWSSPSLGVVNGRTLIFYGGGDGFCYAFDAEPTESKGGGPGVLRKVWWFDCNPPEYKYRNGRKVRYKARGDGPSEIIATPAFDNNRVYVAVGQDPRHGYGKGCLSCIDATMFGDLTKDGKIWTYKDIDRTLSTVSVYDGLVYIADYRGVVHCLDADTGRVCWKHETRQKIWGSTFALDGRVYVGTGRGYLWVFAAGREKKILHKIKMNSSVYTTPVVANGTFYVTSQTHLYAVAAGREAK